MEPELEIDCRQPIESAQMTYLEQRPLLIARRYWLSPEPEFASKKAYLDSRSEQDLAGNLDQDCAF